MPLFNLLLLPFLAFRHVIHVMEIIDVFELSRASKNTFTRVKNAKRKVLPIRVLKGPIGQEINVAVAKNAGFEFTIVFEILIRPAIGKIDVRGCVIDISEKNMQNKTIRCCSRQFEPHVLQFLHYLLDLFFTDQLSVRIDEPRLERMRRELSDPVYQKCVDIIVRGEGEDIRPLEIKYLLEKTQPTQEVLINCVLPDDFDQKQILNIPRICINFARWVTFEDLKTMTCQMATFNIHSFNEAAFSDFIRHWMSGGSSNLEYLKLGDFTETPNWTVVMKDIRYKYYDGRRRERFLKIPHTYSIRQVDFATGVDFERSDGTWATVMHRDNCMEFAVWR
ncbi:unnamed protein product [Caenorhabditis brenneri]